MQNLITKSNFNKFLVSSLRFIFIQKRILSADSFLFFSTFQKNRFILQRLIRMKNQIFQKMIQILSAKNKIFGHFCRFSETNLRI